MVTKDFAQTAKEDILEAETATWTNYGKTPNVAMNFDENRRFNLNAGVETRNMNETKKRAADGSTIYSRATGIISVYATNDAIRDNLKEDALEAIRLAGFTHEDPICTDYRIKGKYTTDIQITIIIC